MDGIEDVGILCLDVSDHLHVGAVKANLITSVADLTADIASDLLEVNLVGGNASLTKEDNHASLGGGLHSDFGIGVYFKAGIEDAIGDLIAKFVGMTLAD